METFKSLEKFDLLAKVELVKTNIGGRTSKVIDGYRGQFFWSINDVQCTDWLAYYVFENGSLEPGEQALCKIVLGDAIKNTVKDGFPNGSQFAIREGFLIIAIGCVLESHVDA